MSHFLNSLRRYLNHVILSEAKKLAAALRAEATEILRFAQDDLDSLQMAEVLRVKK